MKPSRTLFSKFDLYRLADNIVNMYDKLNLVYKFAKMADNKVMIDAYSGIMWELDLIIKTYGLREMVKID